MLGKRLGSPPESLMEIKFPENEEHIWMTMD